MKLAVRAFAALAAAGLALPALAESVSFSADSVQSSLAKGKEMTILSGRASVKTGSVSIAADRMHPTMATA